MLRSLALLAVLVCFQLTAAAEDLRKFTGAYPPELPEAEVVPYKTIDDVTLNAYIYRPDAQKFPGPRPAIVFFFGGGWRGGTPQQFENQCLYLSSRGMVAITADYRVLSRHKSSPFECVTDAKSAIRWIRTEAKKFNVDPNRIVAAGGSAGGHTACCTGVITGFEEAGEDAAISSVPNAMALFNPAVMLDNMEGHELLSEEKVTDIGSRALNRPREISPVHHVRKNLPPTIIFHGTNDESVPFATVELFTKLMQQDGNRCELKAYPDEPHGFFNPRLRDPKRANAERSNYHQTMRQLDTFLVSLGYLEPQTKPSKNVIVRDEMINSFQKFQEKKTAHVAFLGGSITEMNGYRPMLCAELEKRFPETKFTFTNAGISSTCSTTGAFRLQRDVLDRGPVDMIFIEFAVNDDQDAFHTRTGAIRGLEGIIRQVRQHNPNADIVLTYFVNPGMKELLQAGKVPLSIQAHAAVARHYKINTIHLAREVAEQISNGELTWEKFGGTHPAPFGNRICADMIAQLFATSWKSLPAETTPQPHSFPETSVDPLNYQFAKIVPLSNAEIASGWSIETPDWSQLPGSKRDRFTQIPMLVADTPGAEFSLAFEGTTAIAYVSAGPDAGQLEVAVNDGPFETVELFHQYSKGLHYPRSVVLATDLPRGKHRLRVRLSKEHHSDSVGTAARIMDLGVN